MNIKSYLKDKAVYLILWLVTTVFIVFLLSTAKLNNNYLVWFLFYTITISNSMILLFEFIKRKIFYKKWIHKLEESDKKELFLNLVKEADFKKSDILYYILKEKREKTIPKKDKK